MKQNRECGKESNRTECPPPLHISSFPSYFLNPGNNMRMSRSKGAAAKVAGCILPDKGAHLIYSLQVLGSLSATLMDHFQIPQAKAVCYCKVYEAMVTQAHLETHICQQEALLTNPRCEAAGCVFSTRKESTQCILRLFVDLNNVYPTFQSSKIPFKLRIIIFKNTHTPQNSNYIKCTVKPIEQYQVSMI